MYKATFKTLISLQALTDSQLDCGSQSPWLQSLNCGVLYHSSQGYLPKVRHWASHFLIGKSTMASQPLQKNCPLDCQGLQPRSNVCSSPVFQCTAKRTAFFHCSLFPNEAWPPCLYGLLTPASNTLPASTYLNITLVWRWRFASYIICFLNTPDYRDHSFLGIPIALAFVCSTMSYSSSSFYTCLIFPARFPVPWCQMPVPILSTCPKLHNHKICDAAADSKIKLGISIEQTRGVIRYHQNGLEWILKGFLGRCLFKLGLEERTEMTEMSSRRGSKTGEG